MTYLPPDPDGMNDERAAGGKAALEVFQDLTRTEAIDAIGDLLSDLMHLCDRTDVFGEFEAALRRARMHYRDETHTEPGT